MSTRDRMIARRVRGGARADESATLLAELVATCGPGTLAAVLTYQNFTTATRADADVAALTEETANV